jgi:hypothetical protein
MEKAQREENETKGRLEKEEHIRNEIEKKEQERALKAVKQ